MSSSGSSYQSNPVYLSNPCVPHIRYCNVRCPNGLLLGANGCQYCACAVTRTTVPPAPVKVTAGTRGKKKDSFVFKKRRKAALTVLQIKWDFKYESVKSFGKDFYSKGSVPSFTMSL